ncbi:hypothetical protein ABZ894_31370 [Nocardia beijingensis]
MQSVCDHFDLHRFAGTVLEGGFVSAELVFGRETVYSYLRAA